MSRAYFYPHRTQGFAYDCGATAVLTVLQYYGYNNDKLNEQSVFDAIGTSLEGTDNEGIERGLKKLGMAFERVTNLQDLDRHLDEGHPVVVCPQQWVEDGLPVWHYEVVIAKEGDRYIISDPWSINLVWVSAEVFDKIWHDQPDEEFDRWGVAVMGEAKYHGGIVPMDVKLAREARELLTMAKELVAAGYADDFSKSNNALEAEREGKFPASVLARRLGVQTGAIVELCTPCAWHHSSKFYNEVHYYDQEEAEEIIDELRSWHQPKREEKVWNDCSGEYLEWSGSRNYPKAKTIEFSKTKATLKGDFFTLEIPGGKAIRKRKDTRGFVLRDADGKQVN